MIDSVLAVPGLAAITGSSGVCVGATIMLSDADAGGTWASGNTAIATINPSTGMITGVAAGTTTISYSVTNICGSGTATRTQTVNPQPAIAAIAGPTAICTGASVTLTDAIAGGVWSSSNTAVAAAGSTGVVSGITAGTSVIIYTVTNIFGCSNAALVTATVNPAPFVAGISGTTNECIGATTTLADATTGGVWTSTNTSIATVGSTGVVTGVIPGTSIIIYSVTDGAGCTGSVAVTDTVNGTPAVAAISGPASVCVGGTILLSDPTVGGVWSVSNTNATVSGGLVTGVSGGVDTIRYSVTGACGTATVSSTITVNTAPVLGAISGATNVCTGGTTTLTNATAGGVWSTPDADISIGSASGVVTGISVGSATVTYSVSNVCGTGTTNAVIVVITMPDAGTVTGASSVCPGASITLSDGATGGLWSASNGRATVTGGTVTGVTPGLDTVRYSVTNACGTTTSSKQVTISPLPNAGTIYGLPNVCMGASITLVDGAPGGMWSSSAPLVATINGVGVVTPVGPGMTNIIYTLATTCGTATTTHVLTVIPLADCNGGTQTGVSNIAAIVELKVYPNPNRGSFTMKMLSNSKEQVHVTITNVLGQKVKEFITATNSETEVQLNQPAGVYVLTAIADDRRYIEKVTVE